MRVIVEYLLKYIKITITKKEHKINNPINEKSELINLSNFDFFTSSCLYKLLGEFFLIVPSSI